MYWNIKMIQNKLIKPEKLKKGDTIGIISPSGAIKEDKLFQPAVHYFEEKGYKIRIAPHAADKKSYLAGSDKDRLSDLMSFFEDDSISAILCTRGGYGAYRLLSGIDYEKIKANPKIFLGYSDITALLVSILSNTGLITFHGPLFLSDFGINKVNNYTEKTFFDVLTGNVELPYKYINPINYVSINPGQAKGELIAGNLAVLTGLLGTPYFPDVTGKILLIEDIGEPLYKIDRMLMQLKLAGVFDKIAGLLFGEFTNVVKSDSAEVNKLNPLDIVCELTSGLKIPVGYGFPVSHAEMKATLPLGVKYYFNSQNFNLILQEDYLSQE
jgi:muramoyltetrapeptide carboxypeptidase